MIDLIDTHCHIHSLDYPLDADAVLANARKDSVNRVICIGENLEDSRLATEFVKNRPGTWAAVGIHPHETGRYYNNQNALNDLAKLLESPKVVAIGECGLDYYYNYSAKHEQQALLEFQLELAQSHHLPVVFHIRNAFPEFWPIFDNFKDIKGVVHSFSSDSKVLNEALTRGLFIGLNGIVTFTKDQAELAAAKAVPLDRLLLETDAPFLTPVPLRGTICEPRHVRLTAEFLASVRGITLDELANCSTVNALQLFTL